jgi:tRNA threonylcarbamoyladenosine biosynthesis protein TsaB
VLVLGIDSTTLACGVSVVNTDRVLAEYMLQVKKTHSERLLPLLYSLLRDAALSPSDLGGVAVASGPGSFTGLRIGMATARALGQALDIPLAGVSTLEVLASQVRYFPGFLCPLLDARRCQVYNAVFRPGEKPLRLKPDRVLPLADVLAEFDRKEQVLFLGDGAVVNRETIISAMGESACFLPPEGEFNRAATVARLGLAEFSAGRGKSYLELLPRYIRRSEAEVKFLARCQGGGDLSGYDH